jgi:hypothetical protein
MRIDPTQWLAEDHSRPRRAGMPGHYTASIITTALPGAPRVSGVSNAIVTGRTAGHASQ